ncbi:MAG: FtsX-like permease family protein, partial [Chitinophagaceae bacterium]
IYSQLNFIRSKNLGYNREQVLVLRNIYSLGRHTNAFKTEVMQIPGVTAGTRLGSLPTANYSEGNRNAYSKDASLTASQTLTIADWGVDADYIPAMGMKIVSGRNFSAARIADSNAILINETAARVLGFKDPLSASLYDMDHSTGKLSTGLKGGWLRNGLVVFQFVAAIVLIMGTLVIYSQLNYIRSKNLGYDREQVLVVRNAYSLGMHATTFKNEALRIPGVTAGTRLSSLPTANYSEGNRNAYSKSATLKADQTLTIADWAVDADYIPAMGMKIVAGRNFDAARISDSNAMVINETAAKVLGFKDPLTASLYDMDQNTKIVNTYNIVGIVKDFNAGSLRYDVEPVIMRMSNWGDRFAFRVKTDNIAGVVKQVEDKYLSMPGMAGQPFIYSFMDDDFNYLYKVEKQTGMIFISFAFFAILIACLGLFGLVSYATEQRTREIGIRKVLGAGIPNIIRLLSFDFVKLVMIATVVALPIGWIIMNFWLRDFAFRTNLSWWIFVVPALIALVLTIVTTSQQAIRAALINPVKSLKSE